MYLAEEIHSRNTIPSDDFKRVFPLANAIVMLTVLSKEDRKKVEEEYQKTFLINLMDELYVSLFHVLFSFYIFLSLGQTRLLVHDPEYEHNAEG